MIDSTFEQDVRIDRNFLEEENEKQPMLVKKWGDRYVQAEHEYDKKKDQLLLLEETLGLQIRSCVKEYLSQEEMDIKITEAVIAALIHRQGSYEKLREEFFIVKKNFGYLTEAKASIIQKGFSLNQMGTLFVAGYFTTSSRVPQTRTAADRKTEEHVDQLNERITRRRQKND
uniref:Uncharacterized protein n=1 Tax=viral metagenome TaxID=1070528 RepID=A0A6M3L228_9ZZZZ